MVKELTPEEVDHIDGLIEEARDGKIVTEFHAIHCKAIALSESIFSADNGQVFLLKSRQCADPTENTAPAAKDLVAILKALNILPILDYSLLDEKVVVGCRTYPQRKSGLRVP